MRKLALILLFPCVAWAAFDLKEDTASQEWCFVLIDESDGTIHTGETIANTEIKIVLPGGTTETDKNSGGATEIGSTGRYCATFDGTDTTTAGSMTIVIRNSGSIEKEYVINVLTNNWYDTKYGTDNLETDVQEVGGTAQTANDNGADINAILLDTGTDGVLLGAGAVTDASLAGGLEVVFETDIGTNYNTTRDAWETNLTDTIGTLVGGEIAVGAFAANAVTDAAVANDVQVDVVTIETGDATDALSAATPTASLAAGAITDASLAGGMEIVFETDFGTNYNTTRDAWATNLTDVIGTLDASEIGTAAITNTELDVDGSEFTAIDLPNQTMDITGTLSTVTTLTGHTAQTADHTANIATILADTGARDTVTEVVADFGGFAGNIDDAASQTSMDLDNGPATADVLNNTFTITITDASDSDEPACHRRITDWSTTTQIATLDSACDFTVVDNDDYIVLPNGVGSEIAVVSDTTSEIQVGPDGLIEVNIAEWLNTDVNEQTAGYPSVTIKDGTGTGEINTLSGAVVNVDTVDSVTALAANAIGAGDIADDAIEAGDFATGAIDADAIAASAIGASEIAADAITSAEVATSALGTTELDYCGTGIKFTVQNNAANSTSQVCTDLTDADFGDDQFGGSSIPKRAVVFLTGNAEGLASTIQSFDTTGGACSDLLAFTDIGTEPAQDVIGCIH